MDLQIPGAIQSWSMIKHDHQHKIHAQSSVVVVRQYQQVKSNTEL